MTQNVHKRLKRIICITLVSFGAVCAVPSARATTYYIDCLNGTNASSGTSIAEAWLDLDQFTENARSAGDKAIVRRGGTGCDDATALTFLSDGTVASPIILEADYDDAWGDFATSSQTYTVEYASKELIASAAISDISAGDWIYINTEDSREYAYEVASASGATLTLYLPYKGEAVGSGHTLRIMPAAPVWNTSSTNLTVTIATDTYWKIQGLDVRCGNTCISGSQHHYLELKDLIITGDNNATGVNLAGFSSSMSVLKTRFEDLSSGVNTEGGGAQARGRVEIRDAFFDGSTTTGASFVTMGADSTVYVYDSESINNIGSAADVFVDGSSGGSGSMYIRNVSATPVSGGSDIDFSDITSYSGFIYFEDFKGVPGVNRQYSFFSPDNSTPFIAKETSTLRTGGGATSIKVSPSTRLSTVWELTQAKLFEYPVYASATQFTVSVYAKPSSTASFTADPTALEFWIEAEYFATTTNAHRKITKSTTTVNFNGDSNWQALTLSFTPATSGVAYIRGWYAKTKETPDNIFYVDIKPVITIP